MGNNLFIFNWLTKLKCTNVSKNSNAWGFIPLNSEGLMMVILVIISITLFLILSKRTAVCVQQWMQLPQFWDIDFWLCLPGERGSSPDNADPMASGLTVSGCFLGNWEKLNFIVCEEVCKGISIWKLETRFYHKSLWDYLSAERWWRADAHCRYQGRNWDSASSGVKRADTAS